jgi:hypothetical protein
MISKVRNPYFLVPFFFGGVALPVALAISKALTQALQPAFVIEFILFFGLGVSWLVVLLKRKDFENFFALLLGLAGGIGLFLATLVFLLSWFAKEL